MRGKLWNRAIKLGTAEDTLENVVPPDISWWTAIVDQVSVVPLQKCNVLQPSLIAKQD
jgi:hypothetical protein